MTYSKVESEEGTRITTVRAGLAMGLSKSVSGGSVEKTNTQETIISKIINSIIDFFSRR